MAATGAITQDVPANFPTPDIASYRADLAAMDARYKKGLNPLDVPFRDDKLTPYLEFAKELPQFPS